MNICSPRRRRSGADVVYINVGREDGGRTWCLRCSWLILAVAVLSVATMLLVARDTAGANLHAMVTGIIVKLGLHKPGPQVYAGAVPTTGQPLFHSPCQSNLRGYGLKGDPEEEDTSLWQVINEGFNNVRSGKHLFARVIGMKVKCLVIPGRREGNWIKLLHEPGYMLISESGQSLLREMKVRHKKISQGTCADVGQYPITDPTACEAAALALGLQGTQVNFSTAPARPEGCYLVGGTLWMSANPANKGKGAVGEFEPLCSTEAQPSATDLCQSAQQRTTTTARPPNLAETAADGAAPTLFCFSVVRTAGNEPRLLTAQFENTASIFRCDEYAVLTVGGKLNLGQGWQTTEIPAPSRELDKATAAGSQKLTPTFLQAWSVMLRDERLWQQDWIVKVEPDAVFFPGRFRQYLRQSSPSSTNGSKFVLTCDRGSGPLALLRSVEAFSVKAVKAYSSGEEQCRRELPWEGWTEDTFLQNCLQMLGVGAIHAGSIVGDTDCSPEPHRCSDLSKVAFHDFQQASEYMECWEEATEAEMSAKVHLDVVTASAQ